MEKFLIEVSHEGRGSGLAITHRVIFPEIASCARGQKDQFIQSCIIAIYLLYLATQDILVSR